MQILARFVPLRDRLTSVSGVPPESLTMHTLVTDAARAEAGFERAPETCGHELPLRRYSGGWGQAKLCNLRGARWVLRPKATAWVAADPKASPHRSSPLFAVPTWKMPKSSANPPETKAPTPVAAEAYREKAAAPPAKTSAATPADAMPQSPMAPPPIFGFPGIPPSATASPEWHAWMAQASQAFYANANTMPAGMMGSAPTAWQSGAVPQRPHPLGATPKAAAHFHMGTQDVMSISSGTAAEWETPAVEVSPQTETIPD